MSRPTIAQVSATRSPGLLRRAVNYLVYLLGTTYAQWRKHRTIRLGAGIAYYSLFAVVPMLVLAVGIAGIFVSSVDVQRYVTDLVSSIFGTDGAEFAAALSEALDDVGPNTGLGLIGLASLALAATLVVVALQDAFATIWELPVRSGIRVSIVRRLIAFGVVLACGAVIVLSFVLNAFTALLESIAPNVGLVTSLTELVGLAGAWALGIGAIALLFQHLTAIRIPWRAALIGGAITAFMVAVGTVAIGAYLRRFAGSSVAGAAGAVLLVLVWLYYEAQILLAGAELTRVLAGSATGSSADGGSSADEREPGLLPRDDAAVDVDS